MTEQFLHFVDPSIPGLSGRDLMGRLSKAVQASREEFVIRKDLAGLDSHQLRDLGIDRGAA